MIKRVLEKACACVAFETVEEKDMMFWIFDVCFVLRKDNVNVTIWLFRIARRRVLVAISVHFKIYLETIWRQGSNF